MRGTVLGVRGIFLVGLIATLTAPRAASAQIPADQSPADQRPGPVPRAVEVPAEASVPDGLEMTIIREDLIPGQFRIVDIQLDRAVDEEVLESIANVVRDGDDRSYQRTYIVYYLPGMEPGAGGWATSHFTPDLEVQVLEPAR